ncbi:MAG: YIP1 family protein [Melioribacteraceae bacterium]|nr:YIP1 family protein [Melioribacteraceae bacterium]
MDELNKPDELIEENEELGISDKIVSVLTEPGELFSKLSFFPVKTMDWLLPLLLVIVAIIAMQFITSNNPEIKANMIEKQMEQIEKGMQEAVDKGQMTQAQADEQLERTAEFMERGGSMQLVFGAIGAFIMVFLMFFIISGVFLLLAKFALGGTGDYKASMLSYGMPHYIGFIQIIVMIVSAIAFSKLFQDTSIGSYMGMEKEGIVGWFMHKLDPFSIWFYAVVGIAYAKMFKSDNTMKYILAIIGMWLGFSLLMHFAAQAFPLLKQFGM